MKQLILLLSGFACCAGLVIGQQSSTSPQTAKQQSCPDETDVTGKYVNYSYGFSIVIPKTLKGVWNSARCVSQPDGCVCMSDHGRIIGLATTPNDRDHWIEAYAGFATEVDEPTPKNLVVSRLEWIQERSRRDSVSVLQRADVMIGGLRGKRVVVRYYNKESNRVMVEDFVEAMRGRGDVDVEYSLYLRTPLDSYQRDKPVFDAVLRSFTLRRCGSC